MQEAHLINRSGYDGATGVPYRRDCPAKIHSVHDMSAEHISKQIGIVREADFRILGLRFADRARRVSVSSFPNHAIGL